MSEDTSAFPLHLHGDYGKGMTLRDYFAAAAMQSLAPNVFGDALKYRQDPNKALMQLVDGSYGIADAMLEARKEGA
jgi:hypothetical protein